MKKTTMLRNLLHEPGLILVPCVCDCLTARCAEAVGFKSACLSGSSMYDTEFGLPNIGLVTATEVVNVVTYVAKSINIPLIVIADDGFGPMLSAYLTTQQLIRAGASGLYICDRKPSITRGQHGIGDVLPRDEFLGKMSAALEARDKEDKDCVIIARIDAGATMGDEEVFARAKACTELGVDVIFPNFHPSVSKDKEAAKKHLGELYRKAGAPEVMIWGMGPDDFTAKDYADINTKLWVNARVDFIIAESILEFYQNFKDTGTLPMRTFAMQPGTGPAADYLQKLRGKDVWNEIVKRNTK
jgi:2-methylisocitrate lyase-like PEP mutase family enzyme